VAVGGEVRDVDPLPLREVREPALGVVGLAAGLPAKVIVRPLALNTTCSPVVAAPEMRSDSVVPRASAICEATVRCQISS
jgi:hypothetical protein